MKTKEILFYNAIYLLTYFFVSFGISIYINQPLNAFPVLLIGLFFSLVFSLCLYFIPENEMEVLEEINKEEEVFEKNDGGGTNEIVD